jgi:hypothetical protein
LEPWEEVCVVARVLPDPICEDVDT